MKTALQELMEEIEKMRDPKDQMETIPVDCVLDLIESKLEKEKQQIIEAVTYGNRMEFYDASETSAEQYYNENFKNE